MAATTIEIHKVTGKDPNFVSAYFASGEHDTAMFLAIARQKFPGDTRLFDSAILEEVKQGYYWHYKHPFGWSEITFDQWNYPSDKPTYYTPGVYIQFEQK